MGFISDSEWEKYVSIINAFHDDAFQQSIIWKESIQQYGENGDDSKSLFINHTILGLISYNQFRSWPINKDTLVGQIDQESMLLYLNMNYLREQGYLNDNGQFKFDPGLDRFWVNGVEYSAKGDSQTAQARDKVLFHFIVLKREETETGEKYP